MNRVRGNWVALRVERSHADGQLRNDRAVSPHCALREREHYAEHVLVIETPGRLKGEADNLSPVLETPPSREGSVTVTRSRTLPSSRGTRNRSANTSTDEESHPKVLKKQKRGSAQLHRPVAS